MTKEDSKQTIWETWFIISLVLLFVMLFIGTIENSKTIFPNWPYFAGVVIINLVLCLIKGTHVPKENNKP